MMITEVKELPKGWQWVRLIDVCTAVTDGTHYSPPDSSSLFPFVTVKDMTDEGLDFAGCSHISADEFLKAKNASACPQPGDVLFSKDGTVGKVHLVTESTSFAVLSSIAILRPNSKHLDSNFLAWSLRHPETLAEAINRKTGSALRRIVLNDIKQIPIILPPLAEQKRIAAIAQKADRLRRTRRYAIQLSDTYLQSFFLEMFGDPVTNPKGWRTGQLNELCDKVIDCPHSTPIYALDETPYACIRSSDIQKGYLDWSTTKYVDYDEYVKRVARSIPLSGDVIYCREGARFGNAAKIPTGKKVCLGQRMMLFRADFKVATPEFIWGFLNCERTYEQAVRRVGGTASPHVNVEDIKAFATIIPPLPLQEKFAQIVQKFERLRTQQREAERQAEHLFQTLLHRAFRGELTSQDSNDEPASVLLEEIRAQQAKAEAKAPTQALNDAAEYLGSKAKQQDTEPIQLTIPGIE